MKWDESLVDTDIASVPGTSIYTRPHTSIYTPSQYSPLNYNSTPLYKRPGRHPSTILTPYNPLASFLLSLLPCTNPPPISPSLYSHHRGSLTTQPNDSITPHLHCSPLLIINRLLSCTHCTCSNPNCLKPATTFQPKTPHI